MIFENFDLEESRDPIAIIADGRYVDLHNGLALYSWEHNVATRDFLMTWNRKGRGLPTPDNPHFDYTECRFLFTGVSRVTIREFEGRTVPGDRGTLDSMEKTPAGSIWVDILDPSETAAGRGMNDKTAKSISNDGPETGPYRLDLLENRAGSPSGLTFFMRQFGYIKVDAERVSVEVHYPPRDAEPIEDRQ